MAKIDFDSLNAELLNGRSFENWLPAGVMRGVEWCVGDLSGAAGQSLRVNTRTGVWKDFSSGEGGSDMVSLFAAINGMGQGEAAKRLRMHAPIVADVSAVVAPKWVPLMPVKGTVRPDFIHRSFGEASAVWTYRDSVGDVLFFIARYDPAGGKQFIPYCWDGKSWIKKAWPAPRPLYGLETLGDKPVLVCEGEKACDAARVFAGDRYSVVTWSGGAQAWKQSDWSILFGRKVLLWPDADVPGLQAMHSISQVLVSHGGEIKIISSLDDMPTGFDAADSGFDWAGFATWAKARAHVVVHKAVEPVHKDDAKREVSPEVAKPIETVKAVTADRSADFPTMKDGFFEWIEVGEKMKQVPDLIGLSRYLGEVQNLKTTKAFSYIFEHDHYVGIDDLALKSKIDMLTLFDKKPRQIEEFLKAAIYKNYCSDEFFVEPDGFINLQNGVLDVVSGDLKPNDGSMFFKYVLPHIYDPAAKCDRWLEFLDYVFEGNEELADLSAEIFGYVLSGGVPWLHKAFFLDGSGRNGKSTWLDVLKHLIGKSNYCSIPMRNLDKPFSVVMADGKLANIVGELEGRDLSSETFKIAVGGEELTAAHKGKPEYQLEFRAKLVFATNNPPVFSDKSAGNYERLCILPFNKYIPADERDPDIVKKILPDLPGILNWALIGLNRLKIRGRLPKVLAIEETLKQYRTNNDSVFQWAEEYVLGVSLISGRYVISDYYDHYLSWCRDEKIHPVGKVRFGIGLSREIKARVPNNITISRPNNKLCYSGYFSITADSKKRFDNSQLELKNRYGSYSD